ncbi:MAG: hypothetical protein RL551_1348 [Pseudomonadota bacterium]
MGNLLPFLVQWGLTSLSLWVASYLFSGLRFADGGSLLIAALLLDSLHATAHCPHYGTLFIGGECLGTDAGLCSCEWLYDLQLLDRILC